MAALTNDEAIEGRIETTIQIRISEAKNLLPSRELRHGRDAYIITALDQEEIFRTASAERTLTPFFGEEYSFRVPRDFRRLSFYICDSDPFALGIVRDSKLGKVAISKEDLILGKARDETWYPIQPIQADTEVQGKIHLSLNVVEKLYEGGTTKHFLSIGVIECCGLSIWGTTCSGLSDPYCQAVLLGSQGQRSEVKRGLVIKKVLDPKFNDKFEFPVDAIKSLNDILVRVSVWHQILLSEDIFLGEVNISLSSLNISRAYEGWFMLSSRRDVTQNTPRPDLGSLRLLAKYSKDCVFPLKAYETLQTALLESLEYPDITDSALYILSEVHKERSLMAQSLVKIFHKLNKIEELMQRLIDHEVQGTSDPNTLFRGNSLASKVLDEFMKLMGQSYLQRTLQFCIDEIFDARKPCEIDASKLQDGEHLDVNMANLLFFVEKILSAITASARSCPRVMCQVFAMLKEAAIKKFPEKRDTVQYTAVSGFIFLRFFAPAILSPKLFHLRPEYANPVVARTLTLISKSIQNMGNIGSKAALSSLTRKEGFMAPLNMELMDASHIKQVKDYLAAISDPMGGVECPLEDMVYREGFLVKRSQGRTRGPKNWRKRYFCLTAKNLTYAKAKGESPLCTIASHELLAVERVDDNAFTLRYMFQLVQPERILYMQAKNSVELIEWLSALAKACSHSHKESDLHHSGVFINSNWTCCGSLSEDISRGCIPISLAVKMLGKQEDIDLERELHRVYKIFLQGQANLLRLKDEATAHARDQGEDGALPRRLTLLCELLVFIKNLELTCSTQLANKAARLGSKQAPYSCGMGEAHVVR